VTLVDRLEVERLLEPGVVEVVLLVQLRDEAVGARPELLESAFRGRLARHAA
jgi:hypothetical protein